MGCYPSSVQNVPSLMLETVGEGDRSDLQLHAFHRTFACLLRKAGADTMTIKDLGRWESREMMQRYVRSVSLQDSMRFYTVPLS